MSDQHYHEAVGWMASMIDGRELASGSHRAKGAGCPEISQYLLGWADQKVDPLFVEWADRDRNRAAVRDLLASLMPDDEAF